MTVDTFQKLYVEELRDLYSAENQILKALPKMIKAASHKDLKRGFTLHERQTRQQVKRLDRIFKELDESPRGRKCVGMEALLKEGAELIKEKPEPDILDAGLISKAQHVEHYEMAGYGSVRTWAEALGFAEQAQLLQETLNEEKETDETLTELAERVVNVDALAASAEAESQPSARQRRGASGRRAPAESQVGRRVEREPGVGMGADFGLDSETELPDLSI